MFPTIDEFGDIIRYLSNWKAAGTAGVYNFFIKRMKIIHKPLNEIIKGIILEAHEQPSWFYQGLTYLIPKKTPSKSFYFRSIICMSNLYQLPTKYITQVMQLEVEKRELLGEKQFKAILKMQRIKEQDNQLKSAWINMNKTYD
ncbi:hypothetical protein NUSPORA_02779 [Nucleospora cyclopteri]